MSDILSPGSVPSGKQDFQQILPMPLAPLAQLPWLQQPKAADLFVPRLDEARQDGQIAPSQLNLRVAACERRLEMQEDQGQLLQRVATELRQTREGSRMADERIAELERSVERSRRDEGAAREQLRALQADFREFAVMQAGRQRAEIESEVSQILSRQSTAAEEWRAVLMNQDAQLLAEVGRASNGLSALNTQLLALQSELRSRLVAVEAVVLSGRVGLGVGANAAGALAIAGGRSDGADLDHMQNQMEVLKRTAAQAAANVADLYSRLDGEASLRAGGQRDLETKLRAIVDSLSQGRADLHHALVQRLEVVESRLGVERKELLARQAELRDSMASGEQEGHIRIQDFMARTRADFEAVDRRIAAEVSALRDQLDASLAQIQASRIGEEEARRESMASWLRRGEESGQRQLESMKALRQEMSSRFRDVQEVVRAEVASRVESEQRLLADASEAVRTSASKEASQMKLMLQKHNESVAQELDRLRQSSAERADRLSRYVDEVVSRAVGSAGSSGKSPEMEAQLKELMEGMLLLRHTVQELSGHSDRRLELLGQDFRLRLQRSDEAKAVESKTARKDTERLLAAVEKRTSLAHEELKNRFEAFAKHFDSQIQSLQAAMLRPREPKSIEGGTSPMPRKPLAVGRPAGTALRSSALRQLAPGAEEVFSSEATQVVLPSLGNTSEVRSHLAADVVGSCLATELAALGAEDDLETSFQDDGSQVVSSP